MIVEYPTTTVNGRWITTDISTITTFISHQDILIEISEISLKKRILQLFFSIVSNSFRMFLDDEECVWGDALGLRTSFL